MDYPHTILIPTERVSGKALSALIAGATQAHFYCPICGEVWAVAFSEHPTPAHHYIRARCTAHGGGRLYPFFNASGLPHALLVREALLELTLAHPLCPNGLPEPYNGTAQCAVNPVTTLGENDHGPT